MKSYLLFGISDAQAAAHALDCILTDRQQSPWLLRDATDDVVAYFDIWPTNLDFEGPGDTNGAGPMVMENISGRHYNEDAAIIAVLQRVQKVTGGLLKNDNDELVTR